MRAVGGKRTGNTGIVAGLVMAMVAGAGCGSRESRGSGPVVERETVGDTTVVRTVSGSVWGDTARLVEELRIGKLDGPAELTLGAVSHIAVGRNGSIYVADERPVSIRMFDSTGTFVRTIGRTGQGPGEYERIWSLTTLPDGRLAVLDSRTARVNIYSPSGEPLHTVADFVISGDRSPGLAADTANNLYILAWPSAKRPSPIVVGTPPDVTERGLVFLRVDTSGHVVDTLDVPRWPLPQGNPVWMGPAGQWAFHPHGFFLAGMSDRYSFDLRHRDGRTLRIERTGEPTGFEPGERAELEKHIEGFVLMPGPEGRNIQFPSGTLRLAHVKPAYRALIAADDGRIWVHRYTPAQRVEPAPVPPARQWREPTVYDVFEPDGRYLGPVAVPANATFRYMRGQHVWGNIRGESDEPYVVRWRLEPPAGGP